MPIISKMRISVMTIIRLLRIPPVRALLAGVVFAGVLAAAGLAAVGGAGRPAPLCAAAGGVPSVGVLGRAGGGAWGGGVGVRPPPIPGRGVVMRRDGCGTARVD